jgi:hypothetical protein
MREQRSERVRFSCEIEGQSPPANLFMRILTLMCHVSYAAGTQQLAPKVFD